MKSTAMESPTVETSAMESADAEAATVKSSGRDTTPVETSAVKASTMESAATTMSSTATRSRVGQIRRRCHDRCGEDREQRPPNVASFQHFFLPGKRQHPRPLNSQAVREFRQIKGAT